MSIIGNLSKTFTIATMNPPDSSEKIEGLKKFSNVELPADYLEFIGEASEIEIKVKGKIYIRFWDTQGCIEMNEAYKIQEHLIPETLAIGDNGGCGTLFYMDGKEGFGIYQVHLSDLDIDEAVKISSSLRELLLNDIGVEKLLDLY